jgi:uncharacterized membrane protein YkoI
MAQQRRIAALTLLTAIAVIAVGVGSRARQADGAAAPANPVTTTHPAVMLAKDAALKLALAQSGAQKAKSGELECEDGRLLYSFEVSGPAGTVKVSVDAYTGEVVVRADDDDNEAKAEGAKKGHVEDADDNDDEAGGSCSVQDDDKEGAKKTHRAG